LEIIAKAYIEIAYHNQEFQNFKEERQKLYEEIEMLQETINAKDKANKDLKEIVERPQRSY
jgi:predicted  nucleic acid-binding Zn-ribbon protein